MIDLSTLEASELRPLKRTEYDQLIELGLIELIGGLMLFRERQAPYHYSLLLSLAEVLAQNLKARAEVRPGPPLPRLRTPNPSPTSPLSRSLTIGGSTLIELTSSSRCATGRGTGIAESRYAFTPSPT